MFRSLNLAGATSGVAARVGIAVLLFSLGSFLIYGTGFAGANLLHNAAHDTRQAVGFPCH